MKKCKICGIEIPQKRTYCDECVKEVRINRYKKPYVKTEKIKKPKAKKQECDTHLCKTCLYRLKLQGVSYSRFCCGYLYYTGHMRNSEPSQCDKYTKYSEEKINKITNNLPGFIKRKEDE